MENKEIENQNVQNNNTTQPEQNVPTQEQVQQVQQVTPEAEVQQRKKSMFNGEEEVIYTFEEEKEGSPLIPILLFIALIGIILILPLISKKISFNVFEPTPITQTPTGEEEGDGREAGARGWGCPRRWGTGAMEPGDSPPLDPRGCRSGWDQHDRRQQPEGIQ